MDGAEQIRRPGAFDFPKKGVFGSMGTDLKTY
jgi:hypothetical protein